MSKVSNSRNLTASAIRKLRNAAKQLAKRNQAAMNEANALVVEARKTPDKATQLAASVMRSSRANNGLQSSASRDRLKGGTTTAGFQGPRGFHTPKGTVTAQEQRPGQLVGRDASKALPAPRSKPFAIDGYTVDKAEGEGSVMRLSKPFKVKGNKARRQWLAMDLNESARKPFDEHAERLTDGNAYRARQAALRLK